MRYFLSASILCISGIVTGTSCEKYDTGKNGHCSEGFRKVQFMLYTNEDFSTRDNNITFALSIRRPTNEVLWDSVLAPMKVSEIPAMANKLLVEKSFTSNTCEILKVGFIYYIEDVGVSWFWEKIKPDETFKRVEFNFH